MENKTEWDLSYFGYKSIEDPKIKIDYHLYETSILNFVKKWNIDTDKIKSNLLEFLKDSDQVGKPDGFWHYLSLASALNQTDSKINKINQELSILANKLSEQLLFINEKLKEIGSDYLIEASNKPEFSEFKNDLVTTAETIKYLLSDKEEALLMKVSEADSDCIFDEYNAALNFIINDEIKTLEEVWSMRNDSNKEIRTLAFDILSKEFNMDKNRAIFSNIYSKICKQTKFLVNSRNIPTDVLYSRNVSEQMDSETVNKLLSKVKESYPLYQEFLKAKAKLFGVDKLDYTDIIAPFPTKDNKEFDYESGLNLYLDTIKKVDNEIYEHSKSLSENGKIDVFPKKGKSGGAFCSYTKTHSEWVLLNWTNKDSDTTTLAHELGHAFHGFMSKDQNETNYHSSLCMAETASIFNETVMFNELLNNVTEEQKIELICNKLDDLFSTIFRQVMYVDFEKKCHQSWLDGKPLSWEDYNQLWFEGIQELYGDSINLNQEQQQYGWMTIPHIYHTPFYCYAYAFGNILSLNVYEGYIQSKDKEEYMTMYKSFLKLGGSKRPKDAIMDVFGLDINDDKFYDMCFDYIKDLISKLK